MGNVRCSRHRGQVTAPTMLLIMCLWTTTGAVVALMLGRAITCADARRYRGEVTMPATAGSAASSIPAPRAEPAGEQVEVPSAVATSAGAQP